MTNKERLEKLRRLISSQFLEDDPFLDSIHDVNDRITDYLLYWEDRSRRAMVCARTGNITAYRQCDNGVVSEKHGDDLQIFSDMVDARIMEMDKE